MRGVNMEMTAKIHVPTMQYGFIEVEFSFVEGKKEEFYKEVVSDFKTIQQFYKDKTEYEYGEITGIKWRKQKGGKLEHFIDNKWVHANEEKK